MNIIKFLSSINRYCDEIYLDKIDCLYKKAQVSKLARWHLIERLRQIPHLFIESKIPVSAKILDIGTGRGGFSIYSALKSDTRTVFGIDTDIKRFNDAVKVADNIKNCFFINTDLEGLKKKNEKFDVILSMDILHHNDYYEQHKIVRQMFSLLNDNGLVIVLEPGDYPKFRHFMIWLFDFILYFPFSTTCKYRNSLQWKKLFEKYNFNMLESYHIINRGYFFTRKVMIFEKN